MQCEIGELKRVWLNRFLILKEFSIITTRRPLLLGISFL